MKKETLRSLVQLGLIHTLSALRFNRRGLPFVTALRGDKSLNIYLGRKTHAHLTKLGRVEGDKILRDLVHADIVQAITQEPGFEGQTRFKLSIPGESTSYATSSEMTELFGMPDIATDFDRAQFVALFASRDEREGLNQGPGLGQGTEKLTEPARKGRNQGSPKLSAKDKAAAKAAEKAEKAAAALAAGEEK